MCRLDEALATTFSPEWLVHEPARHDIAHIYAAMLEPDNHKTRLLPRFCLKSGHDEPDDSSTSVMEIELHIRVQPNDGIQHFADKVGIVI